MIPIYIDFTLDGKKVDVLWNNPGEVESGAARDMGNIGRAVTTKAARMISNWLSPSHSFGVGVTGKSSQNVQAKKIGTSNNVDVWGVVEGGLTEANTYIRFGRSAGKFPDVGRLTAWVAHKAVTGGLKIKLDTGKNMRFTKPKSRTGASRPWKQHRSRYRGKQNVYQSVAYLIGSQLKARGGNISHFDLHPKGGKRFDYAAYLVTRRKGELQDVIDWGAGAIMDTFIHYIRTGRYSGKIGRGYGA